MLNKLFNVKTLGATVAVAATAAALVTSVVQNEPKSPASGDVFAQVAQGPEVPSLIGYIGAIMAVGKDIICTFNHEHPLCATNTTMREGLIKLSSGGARLALPPPQ